jgi:DNA invertase Pin-like site-specific DNA recombinase
LEMTRDGDALAVWQLDRIGRSLPHVVGLVGELEVTATIVP